MRACAMLAPAAAPLLALSMLALGLTACGEEPPAVSEPRPRLSAPNDLSVASELSENQDVQLVNVVFIDGQLTGDVGNVPVVLGSMVRLTIVTDVVETVVVEGFEQQILTAADQPVQLELVAQEAGEFDVKLRESGKVLVTLDVR